MACLIFGAIHHTIKGVQSGIQAHKDFKSPHHIIDADPNSRAPVDRFGHAKEHHPVYGWVMKAEHKFNKGKGRAAIKEREEEGMDKEQYEDQRYEAPMGAPPAAPPTYEAAVSGASMPPDHRQGSAAEYYQTTSHTDEKRSNDVPQSKEAPHGFEAQDQDSSSTFSDSDLESESEKDQLASSPSNRQIRKKERRVRRAERKLRRASAKAERKGDGEKVRRAEERLVNAQTKLEATKASAS